MATTAMTTAQVAEALDTTPRELRKFLRADAHANGKGDTLPGKGSRYALPGDKRSLAAMAKKFIKWQEVQADAKAARDEAKRIETEAVTEVDDTDEPTEADLDDIEDED